MKPQTDEETSTEEPTSADLTTTMTATEAVTEISSPTTVDQTEDMTTAATVTPTTFEQTTDTTQEDSTQSRMSTAEPDDRTSQPANSNSVGGTEPQTGSGLSLGIIVGPVGAVVLLLISGAVIAIAVVLFRKRKKSAGRYSTSSRGIKSTHKQSVGE